MVKCFNQIFSTNCISTKKSLPNTLGFFLLITNTFSFQFTSSNVFTIVEWSTTCFFQNCYSTNFVI